MAMKSMLKWMFTRYGLVAAQKASYRGCYEASVPKSVIIQSVTTRQRKYRKLNK